MAAKKASGKEATRAAVDSSHVEVKSWTNRKKRGQLCLWLFCYQHEMRGKACHEYGYTQAQVAAATGLHYSSVSKNSSENGIIQDSRSDRGLPGTSCTFLDLFLIRSVVTA